MKIFLPHHPTAELALAAALMAGLGCSGGDMNSGSQGDSGSGGTSFATDVYPVLKANCVGCHVGGSGLVDFSVSAADAWSKLVGQTSPAGSLCASSTEKLVVAGNSAMSILYSKVSAAMPVCGQRMPFGQAPLSTTDQTTIKNWIDQGAKP